MSCSYQRQTKTKLSSPWWTGKNPCCSCWPSSSQAAFSKMCLNHTFCWWLRQWGKTTPLPNKFQDSCFNGTTFASTFFNRIYSSVLSVFRMSRICHIISIIFLCMQLFNPLLFLVHCEHERKRYAPMIFM